MIPSLTISQREKERKGSINGGSDHLDAAAGAALAVDHLAALLGFHPGAEADGAGAFHFADLVGVVHG